MKLSQTAQRVCCAVFLMIFSGCTTVPIKSYYTDRPERKQQAPPYEDANQRDSEPRRKPADRAAYQSGADVYRPASNTQATGALQYEALVMRNAKQYYIDHYLMLAIIQAESNGNTQAVSRADCRGLTQLLISTARDYHPTVTPNELHNPEVNIQIASRHMARLRRLVLQHFPEADLMRRVSLLASAWNAGWSRVKAARGVPNIAETERYAWKVAKYYRQFRWNELSYQ